MNYEPCRNSFKSRLTGCRCLTHERYQLLLDFLNGIEVVDEENMFLAGLAGDVHQFSVIGIGEADNKNDVT